MNLGQQIKAIRENKKLSQQELADKVKHLNQSQISKIEKGDRKVTAQDLLELSAALGVTVDNLLLLPKRNPQRTGQKVR